MLTQEENDLLCRVEGDAPMGGIMRSHWLPACLSEELPEPDCAPVDVRLLGEDLVAFRDTNGRIGLVQAHCPHRRAPLILGRVEDCTLTCLYHGWKYDADGNCLEMASEPESSALAEKVKITAYPTHEHAGIIFAYMGDKAMMPPFDPPCWTPSPDTKVAIAKLMVPANWAQILEGSIDSSHSSSLHSSDMLPRRSTNAGADDKAWYRPSTDKSPRMQCQPTSFGFRYAAIRRPITNAQTHDYIRTTLFIAPYTALIPPNNRYFNALMHAPTDDETTALYFMAFGGGTTPSSDEWRRFVGLQVGIDLDENYRPLRTRANKFKQDRNLMKLGNFTGINGFINQDMAMWAGMGAITDRTAERLGASDLAIVEFRRIMVKAAKDYRDGAPAIGTAEPRIPHASLSSFEGIVEKNTDWRALSTGEVEKNITAQMAKSGKDAAE